MVTDLLARARAGDGNAFETLVEPHRRELRVHCYRMLGSVQDAEDLTQETLLAAWRGIDRFEERASLRTWLYRIATNRCLNALRAGDRRLRDPAATTTAVPFPPPTRWAEPTWLEPYPDTLLDPPSAAPGPDARYESREAISLAFVAAMQTLPPRQRAVLVLRDVLGYRAAEVATMLDVTEEAVTSALKRARATLPAPDPGPPESARGRDAAASFADAMERGDISAMVDLLTDDAWMRMPPLPLEYQGREVIRGFLTTIAYRDERRYRLIPTRANGQPAYGCYLYDRHTSIARAHGTMVLTMDGDRVSTLTRFLDNSVLAAFGLPRTLRD
jgi:RNA polymerase sigma-70 factor (TIGR02960 family)